MRAGTDTGPPVFARGEADDRDGGERMVVMPIPVNVFSQCSHKGGAQKLTSRVRPAH